MNGDVLLMDDGRIGVLCKVPVGVFQLPKSLGWSADKWTRVAWSFDEGRVVSEGSPGSTFLGRLTESVLIDGEHCYVLLNQQ